MNNNGKDETGAQLRLLTGPVKRGRGLFLLCCEGAPSHNQFRRGQSLRGDKSLQQICESSPMVAQSGRGHPLRTTLIQRDSKQRRKEGIVPNPRR